MAPRGCIVFVSILVAATLLPLVAASSLPRPGPASAPTWDLGQWWQVRFTMDLLEEPLETTVVVAGVDKGEYLLGLDSERGLREFLIFHLPFLGRVSTQDLSYEVHNQRFHPVQFPLVQGARWSTQFNDMSLTATVVKATDETAQIEYRSHGQPAGGATYDAQAKTLTRFWLVEMGMLEVTDHGTGFSCTSHFPARSELLFIDTEPTMVDSGPAPPLFVEPAASAQPKTRDVDRPYTRAALVLIAGGEEGLFSQQVMPPDGEVYEVTVLPHDAQRWRMSLLDVRSPAGTWHLNNVATHAGYTLIEAIGFDLQSANLAKKVPLQERSAAPGCPAKDAQPKLVSFSAAPGSEGGAVATLVALSLAGLAGLAVAWTKRRSLSLPFLLLYAKIPSERVLEHRVRQDICNLLKQQPGLTTQELRTTLEIGWGNVVHHLAILERAGLVIGTRWGHNRNWFLVAETAPSRRGAISALRREAARTVFERIEKTPGISQEDLAAELRLHHSTVIFHINRLMRAELVTKQRDGQRVRYYPTASQQAPPTSA